MKKERLVLNNTPLNHFSKQRVYRIVEMIDILKSYNNFDISKSLSDDTFNANVRFQRQYLSQHIGVLLSSIPYENKSYNRDSVEVTVYIGEPESGENDASSITINIATYDYFWV